MTFLEFFVEDRFPLFSGWDVSIRLRFGLRYEMQEAGLAVLGSDEMESGCDLLRAMTGFLLR